jgi:hypothetical protein
MRRTLKLRNTDMHYARRTSFATIVLTACKRPEAFPGSWFSRSSVCHNGCAARRSLSCEQSPVTNVTDGRVTFRQRYSWQVML